MRFIKLLGLLAVAAMAVMAFAASASATGVTSETGGEVTTPTIHAVNENGHVVLANSIANIECNSTAEGKVESHGEGVPASGKLSSLSFTGCTNSWHVTANANGSLSVNWTSGYNGDLYSSGANVSTTRFGVTCNYETNNTTIGTVTGGNPATLDIEASIPIAAGSSFLCGTGNAKWTGSYVSTAALFVGDIGININPEEVVLGGVGKTEKVKIKNTGTVAFKNLEVEMASGLENDFKLSKTCHKVGLAAGATCEETIECKKAGAIDGLLIKVGNPILGGGLIVKC